MRIVGLSLTGALMGLVVIGVNAQAPASAPTPSASGATARQGRATAKGAIPRLPDGRPDFQGNWSNATITPLERMRPGPLVLTEEAAREEEGKTAAALRAREAPSDPNRGAPPVGGEVRTRIAWSPTLADQVVLLTGWQHGIEDRGEPEARTVTGLGPREFDTIDADPSILTAAFGCYRLELPEGAWVDVLEAARATDDSEEALAEGDLDRARSAAVAQRCLHHTGQSRQLRCGSATCETDLLFAVHRTAWSGYVLRHRIPPLGRGQIELVIRSSCQIELGRGPPLKARYSGSMIWGAHFSLNAC